jgi:hypothetical protein
MVQLLTNISRWIAGTERDSPSAKYLLDAGVQSIGSEDGKEKEDQVGQIGSLLRKLDNNEGGSSPTPLATVGTGLPALPKKLIARVLANDLAELHPAKGKGTPMPQLLEGQTIVVQAAALMQTRKIIPDLATWIQCFAIYAATLCSKQPA